MDRISGLPDLIIHHILSFIPFKEAARTSILSKLWLCSWSTYPVLYFSQDYFGLGSGPLFRNEGKFSPHMVQNMKKFLSSVDNTLARYHEQKLRIREFALSINILEECNSAALVDKWIEIVMENRVKDFTLYIPCVGFPYAWPRNLHMTKCDSLNSLHLHGIILDEPMMQKLISACPLLETFILYYCKGFKRIHVANLHRLKTFETSLSEINVIVDVEAPSLESFTYSGLEVEDQSAININASVNLRKLSLTSANNTDLFLQNFIAFVNLRELELISVHITDLFFQDFRARFPLLERLTLHAIKKLERINISSHSLKHLHLIYWIGRLEAKIDAPNLLSLDYGVRRIPSLSFINTLDHLVKIQVTSWVTRKLRTSWFLKLKELLGNLNHVEVFLEFLVFRKVVQFKTDQDFKEIRVPPKHEAEYLEIKIDASVLRHPVLVDCLFWSCHPRYLSVITRGIGPNDEFLKFLSEKLMKGQILEECCWSNYLQYAEVEDFNGNQDDKYCLWKTLTDAWPALAGNKEVRFRLKWK